MREKLFNNPLFLVCFTPYFIFIKTIQKELVFSLWKKYIHARNGSECSYWLNVIYLINTQTSKKIPYEDIFGKHIAFSPNSHPGLIEFLYITCSPNLWMLWMFILNLVIWLDPNILNGAIVADLIPLFFRHSPGHGLFHNAYIVEGST